MSDSMAVCFLKYFLQKVEDTQARSIIEYALSLAQKHVKTIAEVFTEEKHAVPQGFTDDDVNLNAPRLFSDAFVLHYIKHMARVGLNADSLALSLSTLSNIKSFYTECLASTAELNNRVTDELLSKGQYVKPPAIAIPKEVDFVKEQSFLGGLFAEHRPLIAHEISHLYANIQTNAIGKALSLGLAQVSKIQQVKQYFVKGKELADKHIKIFRNKLEQDDLPAPMTWDSDVTDSTVPPFSEKIMMFHIQAMNSIGIADYGASLAVSMRSDLSADYIRLTAEVLHFANDGANIMIEHGWMEEPPKAVNRESLIHLK